MKQNISGCALCMQGKADLNLKL